jgi:hypothetical protein
MMETTQSINMFLPILITIAVSHASGVLFTMGLYDYQYRAKQMPILGERMPMQVERIRVRD